MKISILTLITFFLPLVKNGFSLQQVTVVGGSGFVGMKVCEKLVEKGCAVTSISKSGRPNSDKSFVNDVNWIAADLEEGEAPAVQCDCMISCLGVIGNDKEKLLRGNGSTNCKAFASAKLGGVKRAVFVSVSSEVMSCEENWLPEFFGGYFDGKRMAEKCALDAVNGDRSSVCFVKPTFIYGGDSFGLLPPRVTTEYGSLIEELLSLGLFKALADLTPGLIKVALRPPSSVDAVADACVSAALERAALGKVLEGGAEINEITNQPPAEGLTNAVEFLKEKTGEVVEWVKEEAPKAMAKLEEMQKK